MIWRILTILSITGIFIVFKVIDKTKTPLINSIFINCFIASYIFFIIAKNFSIEEVINSDRLFTLALFMISFLCGFVYAAFKSSTFKIYFNFYTWASEIILRIINIGSIYFMIRTLNSGIFLNSIVYGIINICVVLLLVLTCALFFEERLAKIKLCRSIIVNNNYRYFLHILKCNGK